jgi:hypothetical protein
VRGVEPAIDAKIVPGLNHLDMTARFSRDRRDRAAFGEK